MAELRIDIAGVPPSGNHYKNFHVIPMRNGKSVPSWYHTSKAKDWWADVIAAAQGRKLRGMTYTVSYVVFTASLAASDVDNFAKTILDGLAHAKVIDNDRKVIDLHGYKRIDRANPRTIIVVRTEQEQLFQEAAN